MAYVELASGFVPLDGTRKSATDYPEAFDKCPEEMKILAEINFGRSPFSIPYRDTTKKQMFQVIEKSLVTCLKKIVSFPKEPFGFQLFSNYAADKIPAPKLTQAPTAHDYIMNVRQSSIERQQLALQTLRNFASQRLGYYTTEQEADDLAAEWLAEIGVDPRNAVDLEIWLLAANAKVTDKQWQDTSGASLTSDACQNYRKQSWQDSSGNPVLIPIGNPNEPHHGSCFRAYNTDLEIRKHGWVTTWENSPKRQPMANWDHLQSMAQAENPKDRH